MFAINSAARRLAPALCAVTLAAVFCTVASAPAPASASTDVIQSGCCVTQTGVFASSYRNISQVNVTVYNGTYGGCENAKNTDSSWAQSISYCVTNGTTFHDFCSCLSRRGFVNAWAAGSEILWGNQNY